MIPMTDLPSEQWTLGSIMTEGDALLVLRDKLKPEHFADARHPAIYEAMLRCYDKRTRPTLTTVALELGDALEKVGGMAYLVELGAGAFDWAQVEYYAKRVIDAAEDRAIDAAGLWMQQQARAQKTYRDGYRDAIRERITATLTGQDDDDIQHISIAVDQLYRRFEDGTPPAIETGFSDIDHRLGGLHKGNLVILAGQTGMGKSAFAGQLISNVARSGRRVLLFNLEMTDEEIAERQLAGLSGVGVSAIHRTTLDVDQLKRVVTGMGQLTKYPIYICTKGGMTIEALRDKARAWVHRNGPLDLLVVDYLQLVNGSRVYKGNRVQEVGEVSRGLKALAKELACPVVALAQLNRDVAKRENKVPTKFDLRESGDIENDADTIWMLYRPGYFEPDNEKIQTRAEVHVVKNRHGDECQGERAILLRWDGPTNQFQDLAPAWRSPEGY
jgi:replicative DNA helicase